MKSFGGRRTRWLAGLAALAVCGGGAAAIGMALDGASTPTDGIASELRARSLGKAEFSVLTQAPSPDASGQLQQAGAVSMLTGFGADAGSAHVAAEGTWGQVILTPVQLGDGPAICIFVGRGDTGGLQNCPSVVALATGEVVLPIWDGAGETVGFVGVVPDGVSAVTEPTTGSTVSVRNNVYVLANLRKAPTRLIFTRSDGTKIDRVRLAG